MAWQEVLYDEYQSFLSTVQLGFKYRDPTVIGPIVGILVLLLTSIILILKDRRNNRNGVLLVGICNSGKTTLFGKLVHDKVLETHTTMKENGGMYRSMGNKAKVLNIVDIPGYERSRVQIMDKYKATARAVIFMIDSQNFHKEIRDVAEYLYTFLTDSVISSNTPQVLIACNKQDETMAKSSKVIQAQLEKEMNMTRDTKSRALEGTASTGGNNTFLGKKNKDFKFEDLKGHKVEFVECTLKNKNDDEIEIPEIEDWIEKIA